MISAVACLIAFPIIWMIVEYLNEIYYIYLSKKHGCDIPRYMTSFPFGIRATLQMYREYKNDNMHPDTQQQIRESGVKTARVQTVTRHIVMTSDHENIKAMLASQFKDFDLGDRLKYFKRALGEGIFTLSGNGWQHSRTMLRPQFTNEQVSRLESIEQSCQDLIENIRTSSSKGLFDIQEQFFMLTLDTATEFLFGESTDSLSGGKRLTPARAQSATEFQLSFNRAQDFLLLRTLAQKFYFLVGGSEFNQASDNCKKFIDYYVDRTLKQVQDEKRDNNNNNEDKKGNNEFVFIKELTKETTDPIVMRDQAMNILLAGRDTTAGTLSFAIALLVRHKDVWAKLRQAILTDFGTGTENITFSTLKRCEYLKYVINEVLRLYPIVPMNFRQATRDTTLPSGGGPNGDQPMFVQKDQLIFYHTYSLHRDQDFWGANADKFVPERWADVKGTQVSWRFLPFNGGPRICLGQQFALTEIAYTITRIVQNFGDVTSAPELVNAEIKQRSTLTSSVSGGVYVKFTPAQDV